MPQHLIDDNPDSKVHGANMGPTWVLSAPGGPHFGHMNLAIWEVNIAVNNELLSDGTNWAINCYQYCPSWMTLYGVAKD